MLMLIRRKMHTFRGEETTHMTSRYYSWSRCSFVNRSLYNFIWCTVFILYYIELISYQSLQVTKYSYVCTIQVLYICINWSMRYSQNIWFGEAVSLMLKPEMDVGPNVW